MKKIIIMLAIVSMFIACGDEEFDVTRQATIDEGVTIVNVPVGNGILADVDCWAGNVSTWITIDTSPVTGGFSFCQVRISHVAAYGVNSNSYEFRTKGSAENTGTYSIAPSTQIFNIWTDADGKIEWRHATTVSWSQRVTVRIEVLNFLF